MAVRAIGKYEITKRIVAGDESDAGDNGDNQQDASGVGGIDTADQRDANGSDGVIDPASIGSGESDAPYGYTKSGRRRNRPVGSGRNTSAGSKRKSASETSSSINSILFSMHMMAAAFLKVPELALTMEESENLSEAITRVSELYDIPLMDEKTMAWVNLAIVAGGIYGPRFVAAKINKQKSNQETPFVVKGSL